MEGLLPHALHTPLYNIKAITRMTGMLAVTLRAWERRYGVPKPQRDEQGYRLYSEYDVHTILWLKQQQENGMNISQAMRFFLENRRQGSDPGEGYSPPLKNNPSDESLKIDLEMALRRFDQNQAGEILRLALSINPIEIVLQNLIQPILLQIGNKQHHKRRSILMEHFVSEFFLAQLMNLLAKPTKFHHDGLIVSACLPHEHHQIGVLMVTLMLRRYGWNVVYLGADIQINTLEELIQSLHPKGVLLSGTMPLSPQLISRLTEVSRRFAEFGVILVIGGRAVESDSFPVISSLHRLSGPLVESIKRLEGLFEQT